MAARLTAIVLFAALAVQPSAVSRADEKLTLPKSPPPVFGIVRLNKAGKIVLEHTVTSLVPEKRTHVVVRNGRKSTVEYTVYVPVYRQLSTQLDVKNFSTYLAPDKKLNTEDLRDELAKPRAAVMTANGKKIDPFFTQLLKQGTLIIVNKRLKGGVLRPGVRPLPRPVKRLPRKAP